MRYQLYDFDKHTPSNKSTHLPLSVEVWIIFAWHNHRNSIPHHGLWGWYKFNNHYKQSRYNIFFFHDNVVVTDCYLFSFFLFFFLLWSIYCPGKQCYICLYNGMLIRQSRVRVRTLEPAHPLMKPDQVLPPGVEVTSTLELSTPKFQLLGTNSNSGESPEYQIQLQRFQLQLHCNSGVTTLDPIPFQIRSYMLN